MISKYDPAQIEPKWQKIWASEKVFATPTPSKDRPKKYVLDMFPYPSGAGLHVGHMEGYVGTDVLARYYRAKGFSVFHPMGWDAFGLPAENYAIKKGVPPAKSTADNVKNFRYQLELLGLSYDWSLEIDTSDPSYYRWTQWLFVLLFKRGLAYRRKAPVNWCPSCETVLSNEQVEGGVCERCNTEVIQKDLEQWFFNIVSYADRLLEGLDKIDWPASTKLMQKNWIGRKEGIVITHKVKDSDQTIKSFSAYPAWLYADSYLVIAPDHDLVPSLVAGKEQEASVLAFRRNFLANKKEAVRTKLDDKEGIFTGCYGLDPITGDELPIWLANFAVKEFGTGVIRCSAHDERDVSFAKKYKIKLKSVVGEVGKFVSAHDNTGVLHSSGPFTGRTIDNALIVEMVDYFVAQGYGQREVAYHLRDWLISRQRYWGAPIPMIFCEHCQAQGQSWYTTPEGQSTPRQGSGTNYALEMAGWYPVADTDLPIKLPTDVDFKPTGESPVARSASFQAGVVCPGCGHPARREVDTMDTFVDSSWYFLRYLDRDNQAELVSAKAAKTWLPVDIYVGGGHTVQHLLFARFIYKALIDARVVPETGAVDEPFLKLTAPGWILGPDSRKMSKRWGNIITPEQVVTEHGADTMRMYEMFMGPFDVTKPWNINSVAGVYRFLARIYNLFHETDFANFHASTNLRRKLNQTVEKVGQDTEGFKFNTAVSAMMELVNALQPELHESSQQAKNTKLLVSASDFWQTFLTILAPYAPHLAEELFQLLPNNASSGKTTAFKSVSWQSWPQIANGDLAYSDSTIAVSIDGKVRGILVLDSAVGKVSSKVEELARQDKKIAQYLVGKTPKKVIFVANKIINFVF